MAEHGEDASVVGGNCRQVQLGEDGGDVLLDGAGCKVQVKGDRLVGTSFCESAEDFSFACAEPAESCVDSRSGEQLLDDFGVECCSACCDAPGRVDELVRADDAVFE
jgi:hypothetical protein